MKRGVMLPPIGMEKENGKTSFFTVGDIPFLDAAPAAVLYWDKIHAPIAIKGMSPQYDIAVERLVNLGIAESFDLKSENSFSHSDIQQMISSYAQSLSELDARSLETWSVMPLLSNQKSTLAAQSSPYLPKSHKTNASIEVQLKNALPVPDRDVPYEDLLEFKESRNEQIQRLHAELSQVASRYVDMMDDEKALSLALHDVNSAVSDLQRVYEERWVKKVTKNLTSAFALDGVLPAGVTYFAGASLDTAFLAGAGVTIVRSAVSASLPIKHENNPYSYALEVEKI
ncbi:DUF6236 family protein [Thalassovita sp.]|uniref:DUF6236 family protein n=1 Tax=Thalassovita sp. TaxID=1979401 RepID=UPI0028812C2C|nr:DUF6236 family protein [Thalassovita sp.]MDF1801741.1 DUF6236 family protein [Thalassovita sp.]